MALGPDDFVFPSFRELAVALVRGVDAVQYIQYHRGTWHGGPYDPRATRFAPICVPTATQISHAVGYAMGLRLDDIAACAIAYFGDGSASEGDFHEAANMAGGVPFAGDPLLPEQRLGDQRADHVADRRVRSGSERRATGSRASASTATTCSPCIASRRTRWPGLARAAGRR